MKLYLDTCSLQRPLDSKTQVRIALEAEAVLGLLELCEAGEIELVSSEVLLFETERSPITDRKDYALEVLSKSDQFVILDAKVEQRAGTFREFGIKPLDALHLASAEAAQADYFCTCDDGLLKKAKAIEGLKTRPVLPVELIEQLEK